MTLNNVARKYYLESVQAHEASQKTDDPTYAIAMSGIAAHALRLAEFAVHNHAIVLGVDEGVPEPQVNPLTSQMTQQRSPSPVGGPQVWGGGKAGV